MELVEIPGPPSRPLVGSLWDIDAKSPLQSLCNLTDTYGLCSPPHAVMISTTKSQNSQSLRLIKAGPIWKFQLGSEERMVIGSLTLMNEVCNEERFAKIIAASLKQVRNGVHDGLGTAYGPQERNWGIAHRILHPLFSPLAVRSMLDDMHDIASQLVMKWARFGPDHAIQVTDDFTRLTLDIIALCGMGYRFDSYYSGTMHPFVDAMTGFFKFSGDRARRGSLLIYDVSET